MKASLLPRCPALNALELCPWPRRMRIGSDYPSHLELGAEEGIGKVDLAPWPVLQVRIRACPSGDVQAPSLQINLRPRGPPRIRVCRVQGFLYGGKPTQRDYGGPAPGVRCGRICRTALRWRP